MAVGGSRSVEAPEGENLAILSGNRGHLQNTPPSHPLILSPVSHELGVNKTIVAPSLLVRAVLLGSLRSPCPASPADLSPTLCLACNAMVPSDLLQGENLGESWRCRSSTRLRLPETSSMGLAGQPAFLGQRWGDSEIGF